jgi:hypothetical protein
MRKNKNILKELEVKVPEMGDPADLAPSISIIVLIVGLLLDVGVVLPLFMHFIG